MLTPVKSSFLGAVLVAQCVLGLPELVVRASTCAPIVYTTSHVETITVESIVTAPHSCFTYTITTAQHTSCPSYACPAAPDCIIEETTTLYVPPKDACCPTTTTATTQGPCGSCQVGCATALETVTVTTSAPATTLYKKDVSSTPTSTSSTPSSTPCTQTIFRAEPWVEGPTKTEYPYTVTQTALEDCGGCEYLDVRNINGLGPVVIFTTTVFDPTPATTTAYACSETPSY